MRRKTSSLPTVIYTYGVHEPKDAKALVDQMYLANKYKNRLVELELKRREEEAALLAKNVTVSNLLAEVEQLKTRKEELVASIKDKRRKARSSKVDDKAARDEITAVKAKLKEKWPKLKEAQAKAKVAMESDRQLLWDQFREDLKAARKDCGVYWGTYLQYEAAFEKAAKTPNPRFHRFDGTGVVGVQVQKGVNMNTLFQIDPIPEEVWHMSRGDRRRATLVNAKIRIGSDAKRHPVWAEFQVRQHRPLPQDSEIKWVKLIRKKVGPTYNWFLQLSVEHARPATKHETLKSAGINLGWRRLDDGRLRMAYVYDYFGEDNEIVVNERNISALRHADTLVALRERQFNEFRPWFAAWLKDNVKLLPEWMTEMTETIGSWKSPRRLASVAVEWRDKRFEGDSEAFDKVEQWRRSDKHLWTWEANERAKTAARRTNEYRVVAAKLAEQYDVIYVDDTNIQKLLTKDDLDDERSAGLRYIANAVAVGEFRNILKNACDARGTRLVKVDAANLTKTCYACNHVNAKTLMVHFTCEKCGHVWDQDANAARNIRLAGTRLGEEALKDAA